MVATLLDMAKQRKDPTRTVRMSISLARDIHFVASARDQSVPEFLAEILPPILTPLMEAAVKAKAAELKARKSESR